MAPVTQPPAALVAAAAGARDDALRALGTTAGQCHLISRLLGWRLNASGVSVELVVGLFRDAHHAWLRADGWTLDVTVDQFDSDAPLVFASAREPQAGYEAAVAVGLDWRDRAAFVAGELARLAVGHPARRLLAADHVVFETAGVGAARCNRSAVRPVG